MNIKLFAPGSEESRCPALPKSQGYSPNKQSCPSQKKHTVSLTHTHTHTHSHSHLQYLRGKQEGEVQGLEQLFPHPGSMGRGCPGPQAPLTCLP